MGTLNNYDKVLEEFRGAYAKAQSRQEVKEIIENRDNVLARYNQIFQHSIIDQLTDDAFRSFLYFENNRHWSGLYRKALRLCKNMNSLINALRVLLDPSLDLADRYDRSVGSLNGLGKAVSTAILLVSSPKEYGVWNNTSEAALKSVGGWPEFPRGATNGQKYKEINTLLLRLAQDLGIDLWTLDAIMWDINPQDTKTDEDALNAPSIMNESPMLRQAFGLERHLHDFMYDNWEKTPLGKEWALYSEQGDDDAGYEYPTGIGRIDLLARHRQRNEWLVIELKRDKTSDEAVGQVLRYMGWVKNQLAEKGEVINGLIITHDVDEKLKYAISALSGLNISITTYEVDFHLKPVDFDFKSVKRG